MHILYYSTSYHAKHGGSIQSIEFFKQLNSNSSVSDVSLFPVVAKKPAYIHDKRFSFKYFLKKIQILQVVFFYRRNKFYIPDLLKVLEEKKPDVLIMQIDSNFLQINRIRQAFPHLTICTQINGSPFDEPLKNIAFKNFFYKLQKKAYSQADLNFFISEFSRKRIMGSSLNRTRDIVLHNGTDTDKFYRINDKKKLRKKWGYPKDAFILGYIGTLDFHKQLELLINVFAELLEKFPSLILVIIGDGPAFDKIVTRSKKLKLESKVILKGWIQHENVNEQLNCFDVAVHHYANSYMNPLKIFEYLSAGLPVVAPNIPSVSKLFRDRKDLLITDATHYDLKKTLIEIITDDKMRESLSNNQSILEEMKENFTWRKYTEKFVSTILTKMK